MPTSTQITNASALSQEKITLLIAALRGSALYSHNRSLYPEVGTLFAAHLNQTTPTARLLSAVHDVVFTNGLSTVAIEGGADGVSYSAEREREEELTLALDALIDRPAGAIVP
jgi:hypothetical protein